jgi:hypothetical protein
LAVSLSTYYPRHGAGAAHAAAAAVGQVLARAARARRVPAAQEPRRREASRATAAPGVVDPVNKLLESYPTCCRRPYSERSAAEVLRWLNQAAGAVVAKGCDVIGASTVKEAHACFLGFSRASASEGDSPPWCRSVVPVWPVTTAAAGRT